ncbi:MAG: ribosome biogenesis GTP-binding protein YihA/YsxC [bacterium]|nr:ribosome biogenesis GTP-binding protein YihA/YsxC [bacterium]MDD6225063.1 ribosome biogenesis GTP-binding protein YihA/YsxC [bacterium]MDY3861437.1 ribosome biogenesis GTP-binding protein YihA/YsxC [Ruminococcus sp.]
MNFNEVSFEFAAGDVSQLPESSLPEVVFSGKSNVGKSSLINKLVQRKSLARVSATPGKTATINFFRLNEFRLVDFPGYGYAKVSKGEKRRWADLVEGYFNQQRNVRLIIQIIDIRHAPSKDDLQMLEYLSHFQFPFAVVLTKLDKLNKSKAKEQIEYFNTLLSKYEDIKIIPFSSVTGEGTGEIRKTIEEYLES